MGGDRRGGSGAAETPTLKRHFEGTHRVVSPEETWGWIAPRLRGCGITRLADITGLDDVGIPVYQAIRPEGEVLSVSLGKGQTKELARISAAMEAIEGWHAERPPKAGARGTAEDFGCTDLLHKVPHKPGSLVTEHTVLDWLDGFGVLSGKPFLAPLDMVRLSALESRCWEPPGLVINSNGLAAGNSLSEAILHGLCEALERHCWALSAELPPERRLVIKRESVADPNCLELFQRLDAAAVKFELIDISLETTGVPAYRALIGSPLGSVHGFRFVGAGCHPDRGVALSRALTEAVQSRLTMIAGARESLAPLLFGSEERMATFRPPQPTEAIVEFDRNRSCAADDIDEDVALIASRIRALTGHEPFAVDLTRPECGVPVVKVIAPGLRDRRDSPI